jgi:hypothetical protein
MACAAGRRLSLVGLHQLRIVTFNRRIRARSSRMEFILLNDGYNLGNSQGRRLYL